MTSRSLRPLSVFFVSLFIISSGFSANLYGQKNTPFSVDHVNISTAGNRNIAQINASASIELTAEEAEFMRLGLLPRYYPVLKICLDGKEPFKGKDGGLSAAKNLCKSFYPAGKGHFSRDFGNPVRMLDWAKKNYKNEKLCKLVTAAVRGDVVLSGPSKKQEIDKNFICLMTKGPFYHATLVVDSCPPIVIEAVGLTGNQHDTTSNKVRMSTWYEEFGSWGAYRLVRPTFAEPTAKAGEIVEQAVSYAYDQLGRPYDYSFSDSDGTRAFYCSELVNKAYTVGAGYKGQMTDKSPERDRVIIAINGAIDGLEPKNKYELSDKVMKFAVDYSQNPDIDKLQKFFIDELIPDCKVLEKAFPDKAARQKLNIVLNKIKSNEGFAGFAAANKAYEQNEKAGKFKAGWGIGKLRELKSKAAIGIALLKDVDRLAAESGASRKDLLVVFSKTLLPIYKNLGTYGELLGGMNKNAVVTLPEGVKTIIKIVDWGVDKREQVKKWPVVGEMLSKLMPGNGDGQIRTDFVSPSDLASASPGFTINYP